MTSSRSSKINQKIALVQTPEVLAHINLSLDQEMEMERR
jgi:hypothetical protein